MNISNFSKCANCGACYNVCPVGAIKINDSGCFYKLNVNFEKCIECGLCSKVCPVNNEISNCEPIHAYAGWHKDKKVVNTSSSGGVFYGIANKVLEKGGTVYGAVYSKDCNAVVFGSTRTKSLEEIKKSKYVESLVGKTFTQIKEELQQGNRVLFCGSPCQVAGLKTYLKKDYNLLLTCDFACGGMPSHTIYKNYLEGLEKKYKSKVVSVDFRPKTHGWKRYATLIKFMNGKTYNRLADEDNYIKSFLNGKNSVRDYCLDCKFSNCHLSDLTIADFWMHEKLSDLKNENGISLVLCNTVKGKTFFESIADEYLIKDIDVKAASYNNKITTTSNLKKGKHQEFIRLATENGLDYACSKTYKTSIFSKIKNIIKRFIYKCKK